MIERTPVRKRSGTYVLWLRARRTRAVRVGRLGTLQVRPGAYGYVGSAFGPGGVRARLRRHVRTRNKALHWHVDHLRAGTSLEGAWITYDDARRECTWARVLRILPGGEFPLEGFGASDCDCPSHLVRFTSTPTLAAFRERLRRSTRAHAPVYSVSANDLVRSGG